MKPRSNCSPCQGRFAITGRTLCVRTADDLTQLLWTFHRYDSVYILSRALLPEEGRSWERRLADAYTECGCDAGGVAIVGALCLAVGWALVDSQVRNWRAAALATLMCFGASLAGKLTGIALARLQLWRDIRHVRRLLG